MLCPIGDTVGQTQPTRQSGSHADCRHRSRPHVRRLSHPCGQRVSNTSPQTAAAIITSHGSATCASQAAAAPAAPSAVQDLLMQVSDEEPTQQYSQPQLEVGMEVEHMHLHQLKHHDQLLLQTQLEMLHNHHRQQLTHQEQPVRLQHLQRRRQQQQPQSQSWRAQDTPISKHRLQPQEWLDSQPAQHCLHPGSTVTSSTNTLLQQLWQQDSSQLPPDRAMASNADNRQVKSKQGTLQQPHSTQHAHIIPPDSSAQGPVGTGLIQLTATSMTNDSSNYAYDERSSGMYDSSCHVRNSSSLTSARLTAVDGKPHSTASPALVPLYVHNRVSEDALQISRSYSQGQPQHVVQLVQPQAQTQTQQQQQQWSKHPLAEFPVVRLHRGSKPAHVAAELCGILQQQQHKQVILSAAGADLALLALRCLDRAASLQQQQQPGSQLIAVPVVSSRKRPEGRGRCQLYDLLCSLHTHPIDKNNTQIEFKQQEQQHSLGDGTGHPRHRHTPPELSTPNTHAELQHDSQQQQQQHTSDVLLAGPWLPSRSLPLSAQPVHSRVCGEAARVALPEAACKQQQAPRQLLLRTLQEDLLLQGSSVPHPRHTALQQRRKPQPADTRLQHSSPPHTSCRAGTPRYKAQPLPCECQQHREHQQQVQDSAHALLAGPAPHAYPLRQQQQQTGGGGLQLAGSGSANTAVECSCQLDGTAAAAAALEDVTHSSPAAVVMNGTDVCDAPVATADVGTGADCITQLRTSGSSMQMAGALDQALREEGSIVQVPVAHAKQAVRVLEAVSIVGQLMRHRQHWQQHNAGDSRRHSSSSDDNHLPHLQLVIQPKRGKVKGREGGSTRGVHVFVYAAPVAKVDQPEVSG